MMNIINGLLLGLTPIVGYYLYVYGMLKVTNMTEMIKRISKKEWVMIFIICLGSISISSLLLQQNDYVYYWDYCIHWTPTASYAKKIFVDPHNVWVNLKYSISNMDYNYILPLMYAIPCRIFGIEYVDTILIVKIFYMFPTYIVISLYINKVLSKYNIGKVSVPLYVLFVATIPLIENVMMRALLDPPVLMISTLILILVMDFDYGKVDVKKCILLGIGIVALMVMRRHWSYWVVGLAIYMLVSFLYKIKDNPKMVIRNSFISAGIIGAVSLILLLFPFRDFLMRSLKNYEGIYAAWNGSIGDKVLYARNEFGILIEIFIVSILIVIVKLKKQAIKLIPLFLLICVPVLLMSRSVIMHHAHFYLIIVPVLLIIAMSMNVIVGFIKNNIGQKVVATLMVLFFVINFMNYACPDLFAGINNRVYNHLFRQNLSYKVLYRSDVDTLKQIVSDINELSEDNSEAGVYVCAGTETFNDSLLLAVNQPKEFRAIHNILLGSQVDLRDGFSTNFFDAKIMVVEDFDYDITENYVKNVYGVIWYLSDQIQDSNSYIGKHYKLVDSYELDFESRAKVYIKTSEFEDSDYEQLMKFYDELYPDQKEIFSDRIREYLKNEKNDDFQS